jgi:hypothetical protein
MNKLILFTLLCLAITAKAQLPMFDPNKVNSIYVYMPKDSMDKIYANPKEKKYYQAWMVYTNGIDKDTIDSIGIRARGNTSLISKKKSFKISINFIDTNREYKGVRKLNLNGNHNDPTYVREYIFNDMYSKAGLHKRRISFIKLYINDVYYGLQSNVEEIDKQWLKDVYNNASGNLYKCSWGASLEFQGASPSVYRNMKTGVERTYDLQTNEAQDDYSDLVKLIQTINASNNANYLQNLDTIFNWRLYMRNMAMDVLTGNWDNYYYNSSNYMLYHDSTTKKFEFITIDTDNTFGIDWDNIDWTTISPFAWVPTNRIRPLATKLLQQTTSRNLYIYYLDSLNKHIVNIDSARGLLDTIKNRLLPFVAADSFKNLDYGYTVTDFKDGFDQSTGKHDKTGIKPFLIKRTSSIKQILSTLQNSEYDRPEKSINIWPNPVENTIYIDGKNSIKSVVVYNFAFQKVMEAPYNASGINVRMLPSGNYWVQVITNTEAVITKSFLKQ